MPDVVALPLAKAREVLAESGWDYEVEYSASGYREEGTENCRPEEYVIRQLPLSDHKLKLTVAVKWRREVLQDGFQNQ